MSLVEKIKALKNTDNNIYNDLKHKFNYYSNKIEGSSYTLKEIIKLTPNSQTKHSFEDYLETRNSLELFDFVIDTLGEPINKRLLLEFHSILKKETLDDERGFKGCFSAICC